MREVAGLALAVVGLSVAVVAGTDDRVDTAGAAHREACQRAMSYGVVAISGSDQRVDACVTAAEHRAPEPAPIQVASTENRAGR